MIFEKRTLNERVDYIKTLKAELEACARYSMCQDERAATCICVDMRRSIKKTSQMPRAYIWPTTDVTLMTICAR